MQNPLRCKTCTPDRPEHKQNRVDAEKHRLMQAEEPMRAAGFIELPDGTRHHAPRPDRDYPRQNR
jgi:hypothetical protein